MKSKFGLRWLAGYLVILLIVSLFDQAISVEAPRKNAEVVEQKTKEAKPETEIAIDFDESGEGEQEQIDGTARLVGKNPAFTLNLSAGSAVINNSIESLMELVFYNLLDQKAHLNMNEFSKFTVGVKRELFPTAAGAYVVVDRFNMGPEFTREIARYQNVPVTLGADGSLSLFDIYLRTDGMRLSEQAELPTWRTFVNNFFGMIPILSMLLPPSFNPNEMYDPVSLIETPFSFPLTVGGFRTMPVGSIRSYNIGGGVRLPVEFANRLPKQIRDRIKKAENFLPSIAPSIFVEGEYRINILRRSKNIAWVGLTKVRRAGLKFNVALGRVLQLLDRLILAHWWHGIPAKIFPLDSNWVKAEANIFNQLYEYDLRNLNAKKAYEAAVKGDFALSMEMYQKQLDAQEDSGVTFHFTKTDRAKESSQFNGNGLLIFSKEIEKNRSAAEIEITDDRGKFYVLQNTSDTNDDFTDALTGKQRTIHQHSVEMKVVREQDPDRLDDQSAFIYKFDSDETDPLQLTLSLRIQDRYTDAHEFRGYIDRLRDYSALPLSSVPNIPLRNELLSLARKKRMLLTNPADDHLDIHVTPSYLGRFDATSTLIFSTSVLRRIMNKSEAQIWAAFAEAYGLEKGDATRVRSSPWIKTGKWMLYAGAWPLGLLNIRLVSLDFIADASSAVDSLARLAESETPLDKLAAFDELFKIRYPDRLAKALLRLSQQDEVPRTVTFDTASRGSASKEVKDMFSSLNGKTFRSIKNLPPLERSRLPDEKLRAFFPGDLRENRLRPLVKRIEVGSRTFSISEAALYERRYGEALSAKLISQKFIVLKLFIKNLRPAVSTKVYLRMGETGKVQLGKFLLGEKVFNIDPVPTDQASSEVGVNAYEFFLSGPLSPVSDSFFESRLNDGGEYQVDLSVSEDGSVWSDERGFRFNFSGGSLVPPL